MARDSRAIRGTKGAEGGHEILMDSTIKGSRKV